MNFKNKIYFFFIQQLSKVTYNFLNPHRTYRNLKFGRTGILMGEVRWGGLFSGKGGLMNR